MKREVFTWVAVLGILLLFFVFPGSGVPVEAEAVIPSGTTIEEYEFEEINPDEITTAWDDSYLFSSREAAQEELERLKQRSVEISETFRPEFEELSGPSLLNYIETEKEFSRSIDILYRITSYNVCYTKLLRIQWSSPVHLVENRPGREPECHRIFCVTAVLLRRRLYPISRLA